MYSPNGRSSDIGEGAAGAGAAGAGAAGGGGAGWTAVERWLAN